MQLLIEAQPLPEQYLDQPLRGNWKNCRDLHIEPDWLLIYRIKGEVVLSSCRQVDNTILGNEIFLLWTRLNIAIILIRNVYTLVICK